MENVAVFGIYPSYQSVERAVSLLKNSGIKDTDVSLLLPENLGTVEPAAPEAVTTDKPRAVDAGARSAGLTWLSGLDVLSLPGLGPLLIAGPLGGALAGVDGSTGSIAGALADFGVGIEDAHRYERALQDGGILLSIRGGGDHAEARHSLLEQTGASHISLGRPDGEPVATVEERP